MLISILNYNLQLETLYTKSIFQKRKKKKEKVEDGVHREEVVVGWEMKMVKKKKNWGKKESYH